MGSWEGGSTQPWGPTQGLTRTEWGSLPAVSRQRVDPYTGLWPLKLFSSPWLCLGFIFLTGCVRAISKVPKSCFVWPLQGKWPVTLHQNVFEVTSGLEPPESGSGRDVCVWHHWVSGRERTLSWSQRNQSWFFSLHCLSPIVWLFHFPEGKFRALRPGYCFRKEKCANSRDGVGRRALLPQAQRPPWCHGDDLSWLSWVLFLGGF